MTALLISSLADSGPKAKMITFDEGYIGKGEIKKKEFYNGRNATFYTNTMNPIIEGKITYDNSGQAYIKGDWHVSSQKLLKGTFLISNTPEGLLSAKKNSGKLQISVTDVDKYETAAFYLQKKPHDKDRYSIVYRELSDPAIKQIEGEVKREHVEKLGYDNVTGLLKNVTCCQVTMKDNSTFSGNIAIADSLDNFSIQFKDGVWNLRNPLIKDITVSVPSIITGQTTITTNLYNSNVRTVEFFLPTEKLSNNVIELFKQSNEGKLEYTSSDRFEGTYNVTVSSDGKIEVTPLKGIYTLCGGQQVADNWIDEYYLTDEEKTYVKRHSTPTSQFEAATALINERYYNAHYAAAEYALNKKDYKTARNYFEEAGKYKNAKEMNRKVEELSALIKDEEKKQKFINKYGTYWGALVYSKEFTLGMTREMCVDIVEDLSVYNINKSEDSWSGTTETWRINYDSIGMATMLFDDLGLIASSYYLKKYPKYMRFRNGKLTEITYNEN